MILTLFVVGTVPLQAATLYWDSNGPTAGAGDTPTGTWGISSFWSTSLAGTSAATLATSTSADTVDFIASAGTSSGENPYTVSLSGAQNVYGVIFSSSGAPTLCGTGTINLWGGGITVPQYAYGTTPQGAVALLPQVILQAPQTWTNNSGNPLTVGGSVLTGGNLLTVAGVGNATVSGCISGSGGLSVTGPGTLTLTGTNTFSGGTNVSGGMLAVAGPAVCPAMPRRPRSRPAMAGRSY